MDELRKSQHALNLILEVLENDGSYHDSLAFQFNYTLLPMHFVHSASSFETFKSKGLGLRSQRYSVQNLENKQQFHYIIRGLNY